VALRGLVEDAWRGAEAVQRDEPDRTSDGCIGPPSGPEDVRAGIEIQSVPDRAVDHDEDRGSARAGDGAMQRELRIGHRLEGREQHRDVVGAAPREDRVDRELLGSDRASTHGLVKHDVVGREPRGIEERPDGLGRGRHHGKPIRPAAFEVRLDRLGPTGDRILGGDEPHFRP
jgi:hypothetical protein